MSLGDNLDFELFGISDISNEFETASFGESEDSDTTGFTPQTPLSLPLYVEPPLPKSNPVASSPNFHVDSLDEHVIDITQAFSPEHIASTHFSSVDALKDNALNKAVKGHNTFPNTNTGPARSNVRASIPSNSITTQSSLNDDASFATQPQHSLTCGSDTQDIVHNVYSNAIQPSTSLQLAQPPSTSFPYLLPSFAGTSTTESQTTFNSSFQQHPLPYPYDPTGLAAVGTFQPAQPSTLPDYSLPYAYNTAGSNPTTVQSSTSSLLHPSSYGTVVPNTTRSHSSTTQVPRSSHPGPSRPYAAYNASVDTPRSLPSTQSSITFSRAPSYGNGTAGVNMGRSLNRAQPYVSRSSLQNTLSYDTVKLNTTELTRLPQQSSTSLPHHPSNLSARCNSSVNWNAAYAALGLDWNNYNINANLTDINGDASVSSHTQLTRLPANNEGFYATQPQYYTTNQGPRSQGIGQGMFPNVSTAPLALPNAGTSIPSYTQSTNNATPFPIQPHYTLNQNSGLQNTNQIGLTDGELSTQVPVTNGAFFAFNRDPRLRDTSQGDLRMPSIASLQTISRQNTAKSYPMTQPFNPAFSGSVNLPNNIDNFSTALRSNVVNPNVAQQNTKSQAPSTLPNTKGYLHNRKVQGTHTNLIVNNPSSVAYYNQRLMAPPNRISMTRYNAYATVPNDEVPPTSGVPSVDLVDQRQFLYPAPLSYMVLGQEGSYYPPLPNNLPIVPNGLSHNHPAATILVPTRPALTHQPAPIQTNTHQSRPVKILPPFPIPGSTSSASMTSTRTKRKRVNNDEEGPTVDGKQKRRRGK
ncbi:hypothetical protein Clacol_008724 [Clathrus columnatus]|uniref:Developmental regulatory protein wetA n=1 Tax=Clathrus columnatus TaxID=1419009 RepID=A0AAV5AJA9_9AGAM|nr:hypothetical protein Clacol_008724 [Clathrus columnatus]